MLPKPDHPDFPDALRAAREAKNLSFAKFAEKLGIHQVMPPRYERRDHADHCKPRLDTWERMNEVLFGEEANVSKRPATALGELVSAIENPTLVRTQPVTIPLLSLAHVAVLQQMTGKGENWLLTNLIKAGLDQLLDSFDARKRGEFDHKVNAELEKLLLDSGGTPRETETAGEDMVPGERG
ncbi:multiprotein-bridging factor 1 family protein [Pseudoduganella sp.]|uniref:helix-turn-helix domain-containing protein n=1 Tax=Pseudoduganella sp. TaxID=1880898 RepID=UPI0035ADD4AD